MNNLSEQEKVVSKYYKYLVEDAKKYSKGQRKKLIMEFSREFSKAALAGTRYKDEKIDLKNFRSKTSNGKMTVLSKNSILKININGFMKFYNLNSNKKSKLFEGFFKLVETNNHEMQHFVQGKDNKNFKFQSNYISMGEALDYTYEDLARRVNPDFYGREKGNYENIMKEGDARRTGCIRAANQILKILPNINGNQINTIVKNLYDSITSDNIEYNKLRFANGKKKMIRSDVVREYTEAAIANDPRLREKYPVLKYEFDKNGMRYSLDDILSFDEKVKQKILDNQMYSPEIKGKMLDKVDVGFSKIMYNTIKSYTKNEKIDMAARYGNEKAKEIVDYIIDGKEKELFERYGKLKQYYHTIEENDLEPYVNENKFNYALESYKSGAGYGIHFDMDSQENYQGFENDEIKFLRSFKYDFERMNYKKYSPSQKEYADEVMFKERLAKRKKSKKMYSRLKKKEKGMLSRIFRRNKIKLLNSSREEAEEPEFDYNYLEMKKYQYENEKNNLNEKRKELDNIKKESDRTLDEVQVYRSSENKIEKSKVKDIDEEKMSK